MHPPFPADLMEQSPSRDGLRRPTQPSAGDSPTGAHAPASQIRRPISDAYAGSWIEVASQPSSSSLSSSAAARSSGDEVITTGLRVTQSANPRRLRRLRRSTSARTTSTQDQPYGTSGSSQEEYDESESGSDRIMTSSNEDYQAGRFLGDEIEQTTQEVEHLEEDNNNGEDDDDENSTALGIPEPSPVFTPQPNAFSHPPSNRLARPSLASATTQESYFPQTSTAPTPSTAPTSSSSQQSSRPRVHPRTRSHTPYTAIAPNHSVPIDHDAALRASLSTLLSCAAAARGLPKRELSQEPSSSSPLIRRPAPSNRIESNSLRLVSESALDSQDAATQQQQNHPSTFPQSRSRSDSSSSAAAKRKAKSPSSNRRKRRAGANHLEAEDTLHSVSPTLMTWVLGAGVMVLFSAISFSAGYALGKEVGRVEGVHGLPTTPTTAAATTTAASPLDGEGWFGAGREGIKSRVWRWGNGSGIRA